MPVLQITSITNISSNFNITFGLADNKREDGFEWLIGQLHIFQQQYKIPLPSIYIIDFDKALKNVIEMHFSNSTPQLCVFYVNKNVALNIKRKWKKPG